MFIELTGLFDYSVAGYDSTFLSITKVSDPAYAMSILFPVAASVNTPLGADILVVTVMAEWLNTLLKWYSCCFDDLNPLTFLFSQFTLINWQHF